MRINKDFLFGKPLLTVALHSQRLPKYKALPILSSDALSSVAYGTEEILRVLILGGLSALALSLPIACAICGLLIILGASYWQTIYAYPMGGGAFTVARENLGPWPGLLAAAALLIDYLLTVAVSVTAGIKAVTSAFPTLIPFAVLLCVCVILFIAWMNLRGLRESATIFAFPTYAFIGLMLSMIFIAIYRMNTGQLSAETIVHPNHGMLDHPVSAISLLLILRAFSNGCSALTGVECIANSVSAFEPVEVKNANQTLIMMVTLLGSMFFGITYIAYSLQIQPIHNQTVLSQIGHVIFGESRFYYAFQTATAMILILAANTAFTGFPRLASILSDNNYLPKQLSNLGDRLSFSNGIILLAVLSSVLVIIFKGDTHALIPLYAVGVFLAFSLSQLGMVKHWWKLKSQGWYWKAIINCMGFLATSVALLVIIDSKFLEGAWIIMILIPIALLVFYKIHAHYVVVERELSVTTDVAKDYLDELSAIKPKVIVPVSRLHRGALAALQFAHTISSDVIAVSVNVNPENTEKLKKEWKILGFEIPLIVLESPYRSTVGPIKKFIREQDRRDSERGLCILVLPEAIPSCWWHHFLHNQRATLLKASLFYNRKHKGSTRIFVDVPYQIKR